MATPKNSAAAPFDPEAFRDTINTVDEQGNRKWVYPKKPKGKFHNRRAVVAVILLALMFIGPFLKWNGDPMFLFNVLERKFIIFGVTFWPQDFHLFFLAMITFFVFIVLFTVVFGRVWCGWACPQTIFMEMVFRKIEYWIEGDFQQQMKLNNAPWSAEKLRKKSLKLTIFFLISFLIGNLVMSYMVGVDEVKLLMIHSPFENMGTFVGVMIFSVIFFFVFTWFREQACIVVCPYGRLQGVLLGKDSLTVAYDYVRGEPRAPIRKSKTDAEEAPKGDCIDCKLCVHVCPTGIDIRNGTQLECVNCTACIDACDEVMEKVHRPTGLIRIDSLSKIAEGVKFKINARIIAYSVVLLGLVVLLTGAFLTREPIEATIIRTPGLLYQKTPDGYISNLYNIQLINKTITNYPIEIKLMDDYQGRIHLIGQLNNLEKHGITEGEFFIELPRNSLHGLKNKVKVGIFSGDNLLEVISVQFMGPPI